MRNVLASPRTSRLRRSALAVALTLTAVGCSDGGGYTVMALNEWDQDVIVAVTSNQPESLRLPARTWGTLFISWSDPSGDLTVFDDSCRQVASLPFKQSGLTLHVGPAGDIELTVGEDWKVPAGIEHGQRDGGDGRFLVARCP